MDNWKLFKGMLKDFHFFYHDIEGLSFGRSVRYFRPFLIVTMLSCMTIGTICQEFSDIDIIADNFKFQYLDLKKS